MARADRRDTSAGGSGPGRKARALGGSSLVALAGVVLTGGAAVVSTIYGPSLFGGSAPSQGERGVAARVPLEARQPAKARAEPGRRTGLSGPPPPPPLDRAKGKVAAAAPRLPLPFADVPASMASARAAPPAARADTRLPAARLVAAPTAPGAPAAGLPDEPVAALAAVDPGQALAPATAPLEPAPQQTALAAEARLAPVAAQPGEAASAPDALSAAEAEGLQPVTALALPKGAEVPPGLAALPVAADREDAGTVQSLAGSALPVGGAAAAAPASAPVPAPLVAAAPAAVPLPVPPPAAAPPTSLASAPVLAPQERAAPPVFVPDAAPSAAGESGKLASEMHAQMPASIDGRFAGWLDFRQRTDGIDIRLGSLVGLLADRFEPDRLAALQASSSAQEYVPLATLQARGVPLRYEPATDSFVIETPRRAEAPASPREAVASAASPPASLSANPPAVLAAASAMQDVGAPSVLPREQELQLPVMVDGSYRGDIDVLIGSDNRLKVRRDSVLAALSRLLRPEVAAQLAALPAPSGLVDAGALAPAVQLRLDETTIEVIATVPPESRPRNDVSLFEDPFANIAYVQPQSFAAAMAIDFGGAYSFNQPKGFRGEAGRIASWVNLGGADGVFIDAEMFYDSEGEASFRRGDIRISKDDPDRAIRYSAGDVLYLTQGFQGAPRIGGIGVQRLYEELNPLRIIRPQGRTSFTLDRAATVEVIVNGVPFRTVRFDPGTYSINDIPYAEGGNNVELLIRDDSGVERRLEFSGYSSANLLAEGLSEFGIVAGFQSDFTARGIRYDDDEPVASGFYRVGVSSNLTLGANAQIGTSVAQIGGEAIYGGDDLLVFARAAFSDLDGRGSGYAWELNAQYRPLSTGGINGFFLEGNARGTSRDFASLGIEDPRNDFRLETAVRSGFAIDENSNVSLGYTRQFARDNAADITRYSLTASRRFGNLAAFATFDRREVEGEETENRFLVTLSLPLGSRSTYARASFDSDRDAYRVEVQRLPRGAVNDLSGTVAVETKENGQEVLGQVRYRHNRFIAGLDNSIIFPDTESANGTAVARYSLRTGIGYTDGRVLVSPTLGEGSFVAVARGRAITDGKVVLNDSPIGPQGVSDALGPAVFGGIRGYVPMRITADVETDTPGFEGASQTINVLPGARTGYLVSVGEEATAIVVATVLLPDGSAASLLAGALTRADGKGAAIETFTNRSGRLVAEDLTAGTYRLVIPGKGAARFTLVEDQVGIVQLGTITLGPLEEQDIVP